MRKRLLSFVLAVLMIVSILPATALAADETVTRIAWVQKLVKTFNMTVEADNYPDNYYSDIDSSASYYKDLMIAVEFGVIDLEAGSAFEPDKPATREFAAHTLNFCLGFRLDEGAAYTYTDKNAVTYQEDVQVAVNRGWFRLSGGKFLPEQTVTSAEAANMLADAAKVLEKQTVSENYENTYTFTKGVIVIPDGTKVVVEDDVASITDCPKTISKGDIFAVYLNSIPVAYIAGDVTMEGNVTKIAVTRANDSDAFEQIDAQGVVDADPSQAEALDDTKLAYYVEETQQEYQTYESARVAALKAGTIKPDIQLNCKKTIKLSDIASLELSAQIKNAKVKYNVSLSNLEATVKLTYDLTVTYKVKGDLATASKINDIALIYWGVPGVGGFKVTYDVALEGSISGNQTWYVESGLFVSASQGASYIRSFKSKSFSLTVEATCQVGFQAKFGITELHGFNAYAYAKVGARGLMKHQHYEDGTLPKTCIHFAAYLYAEAGVTGKVSIGSYSRNLDDKYTIYSEKNSPVRVVHHYEEGKMVPECTRGNVESWFGSSLSNWYTSGDSAYMNSGWAGGFSGNGYGPDGEPIVIYTYSLDDDNKATITSYKGNATSLIVPETIDGYTVVAIGDRAFEGNVLLHNVVLPDTVTAIGSRAFLGCSQLATVQLPDNLTSMGGGAFYECVSLTRIFIPKSLTSVSGYDGYGWRSAFGGCKNLWDVELEDGMSKIPGYLFSNCTGFTEIAIPASVTAIGESAFAGTGLKAVVVPDNVTSIEQNAFSRCEEMETLQLSKNLKSIGGAAFRDCKSLTSIFFPKSLENVSGYDGRGWCGAFSGCSGLKQIELETGMSKVPGYLLYGCTASAEITLPDTVTEIGGSAFQGSNITSVVMADSVTSISEKAFLGCGKLVEVQLSKSLKYIGGAAFRNCTKLEHVVIPKSLEEVSNYDGRGFCGGPFEGCSALASPELESGMTKIPNNLLNGCTGFTTITIPDTVKEIGAAAFCNTNLASIEIPNHVESIGNSAFANSQLENARVPDTVTGIGNDVFKNCAKLKDIVLPNTCKNITDGMFAGCTVLEKIVLPETVTAIRSSAFKDCISLKDITWSKGLETIGNNAFQNCSALTEAVLPSVVKSIGNSAFLNCDALTSITIPDSVTNFGNRMFYDCDALVHVKLGSGITVIRDSTFENCDVLASVVIPRRVTSIGNNAFKDCTKFTSVTIPRSVTSISASAFSYPAILTIYGVAGTYAETFAKENSIKFVDQQIKATAASLDKTELTINKGATAQLNLSVTPENFTDPVAWKTTDDKVVTISDSGEVKAVGVGTATIKVVVGDVSATCKVTVLQPVTGINLNKSSLTMDALGTFQMTASVYPDGANDKRITWSSSDPAIASVDENGLVTALKKGTATITAAAMDGSGVKSTCKVTVSNTAYVCTDPAQLESPHNYDNSCTDVWSYELDGASSLNVTFDARTEMEDGFDYLYILDGSGKEVGKYTGKELAGKTISVPGDTVQIRMASDDAGNAWGFKVTSVKAGSETCQHVWDNGKVTKEPTETETGIKTYTCTRCGETKTETIPKLTHEHSYKAVVTAPTCTEKGYTTHTCACGDSYVDTYVDALGHAWDNGKVTKEPTETETGVKTFTCTRCGETKTEVIPALSHEHSYKAVVTAPTCTAKGYTTHTCACGDSYVDTYVDALGHAWDSGKVTKQPTATEDGVKTYTCTRCGETKTETISATGCPSAGFTDVPGEDNWAHAGIDYCVANGLMSGIGNDLFGPKLTTTRAQIVQILYNLEGSPKVSGTTPFTDLTNDWYKDAVLWAYQTGVVAGTSSTTFEPDRPVTREQIAVILMEYVTRVLKLERTWTPADLSTFPDAGSVSDWAKDALADAVALGLISGASNGGQTLLEPQGSATREQVATILMEFCKNVKK